LGSLVGAGLTATAGSSKHPITTVDTQTKHKLNAEHHSPPPVCSLL
jgi:hypothetical protein